MILTYCFFILQTINEIKPVKCDRIFSTSQFRTAHRINATVLFKINSVRSLAQVRSFHCLFLYKLSFFYKSLVLEQAWAHIKLNENVTQKVIKVEDSPKHRYFRDSEFQFIVAHNIKNY